MPGSGVRVPHNPLGYRDIKSRSNKNFSKLNWSDWAFSQDYIVISEKMLRNALIYLNRNFLDQPN